MIDAVFISDLHLNPDDADITARFMSFVSWAATHTRAVYILGDFFHAWAGDDFFDEWSLSLVDQLAFLVAQGVKVYFMPGNRDFLLSQRFIQRSGVVMLDDPTLVTLGEESVLLAHGDVYCTDDKAHQRLRRLTRNALFPKLFLRLSRDFRAHIVTKLRQQSQKHTTSFVDIVPAVMLKDLHHRGVRTIIHGHIHRPGLTVHTYKNDTYQQYVLSDWDQTPQLLCYNTKQGFQFFHEVNDAVSK